MPEPVVVICGSVKRIAGGRMDRCNVCGADIYVMPTSDKIIAEKGGFLACMDCGIDHMPNDRKVPVLVTKDQLREIRDWFRRN